MVGLQEASPETRKRVSRLGANAYHKTRGLAAINDEQTRITIAKMGGTARAKNKQGLIEAGRTRG
jgi:hypothetical protein